MKHEASVGIVGGGPAGVALALRLLRLGHRTLIATDGRTRYGAQGLSLRALEQLTELGATEAARTADPPSPRLVLWNGAEASPNDECLVDRREFDQALLRDVVRAGGDVLLGSVREPVPAEGSIEVTLPAGPLVRASATLWIDARGRSALRTAAIAVAGPPTLTLQQHFHSPVGSARSGIVALENGWCWVGVRRDGFGVLQRTVRRVRGELAGLRCADLPAILAGKHAGLRRLIGAVRPTGPVRAYPADLVLADPDASVFLVGDALIAPDPLSGHGVFEALSGSQHVAAAVNTCLRSPANGHLARRFVAERARERHSILASLSARVHRQEQRWPTQPFWEERQRTGDSRPVRTAVSIVRAAPVLDRDQIVAADVLITPDHPRGVWRVRDVPVVELLTRLKETGNLASAAQDLDLPLDRCAEAALWLRREGLCTDAGR